MFIFISLLGGLIGVVLSAPFSDNLLVTLPNGQIQGAQYVTPNGKLYYGFRGIPYATPPVGELRFESPQPAKSWDGIWDATKDGKKCIGGNGADVESEDCLFVNVYIPDVENTEKLPVLVWIHGGNFVGGSSSKNEYGPDFLLEEDVIVVSLNYRLGPFGFLSTNDNALPGNLGLKDQNLALKWVHDNIQYFEGDPEKITIFGQSAGGASVGLHLMSKKSAGLFRAAILESGAALNDWAAITYARTVAFNVANAIPGGNYGNDSYALKEFLKTRTADEIYNAAGYNGFYPVLEPENEDAFVYESYYEQIESGNFIQVPIMIGIAAEEWLLFVGGLENFQYTAQQFDTDQSMIIPPDLFPDDQNIAASEIKKIYLQEGETFAGNLVAAIEFISDHKITKGSIKHAQMSAKYVPVYQYQFAYFGRPLVQPFIDGAEKASHSSELPFLFNMGGLSDTSYEADLLTQKRMTTLWTNFAKYLNPTPEKTDLFENLTWPVLDKQNLYLNINNTLEIRTGCKGNAFSKWNDIYETYGRKPFITF